MYEAPDADDVPELMEALTASLHAGTGSGPVVRSAMAHLNLVMIHPFRDGNGRMTRALATLVLTRSGIGEAETTPRPVPVDARQARRTGLTGSARNLGSEQCRACPHEDAPGNPFHAALGDLVVPHGGRVEQPARADAAKYRRDALERN
ncbi:MAG TPA: Fic family protein [Trebonia sp.]|nr:Fic family protein [Trebonia sp.]